MLEPRRWTLYDQSEDFNPCWTIGDGTPPPASEYAERVEVMPVSEHVEAIGALRAQCQTSLELASTMLDRAIAAEAELVKAREITDAARAVLPYIGEAAHHRFQGECPEGPDHLDSRDPECAACTALDALTAALGHGQEGEHHD